MMENPRKLAVMHILIQLFLYSLVTQPESAPSFAFRTVTLTLREGLSATSCLGFVFVGAQLCG